MINISREQPVPNRGPELAVSSLSCSITGDRCFQAAAFICEDPSTQTFTNNEFLRPMYSDYRLDTPPPDSRFRRQDASVEALDLAEYTPFRAYDPYPPSPIRSFSRETPSLISPGSTASSSRSPVRRPYSLPASYPHIAHDDQYQETEVDIGNFPAFSRHWYKGNKPKSPPSAYAAVPHEEHLSPFDPSFPTYKYNSHDKLPFSEPGSLDSHARNVLPWENEAQDQSLASVDGQVKQERMRMLEKEFAGVGKPGPYEETLTGSVDQRGRLITEGPRKRLATRYFQAIFTLGAAISAIYASVVRFPLMFQTYELISGLGHQTKGNPSTARETPNLHSLRSLGRHLSLGCVPVPYIPFLLPRPPQ